MAKYNYQKITTFLTFFVHFNKLDLQGNGMMRHIKLTKFQIFLFTLNVALIVLFVICNFSDLDKSASQPPDSTQTSENTAEHLDDDPFYPNFRDFNENQTKEGKYGYLYFRSTSRNLKKLYAESIKSSNNSTDYPLAPDVSPLTLTVVNTSTTEKESDFVPNEENWVKFNKSKNTHSEDGRLKDNYVYFVAELKISNTSESDVDLIMTNPAMMLHFLDKNGERFWYSPCSFFSYQPGDSERNAAKIFGFKKGDSFTSKYVFVIPRAALKYFDCCLTVSALGDTSCDPDYTAMLILDKQQ